MKPIAVLTGMMIALCGGVVSCFTPQFFTVTIYDSPQRVVRLKTVSSDESGQGYSHPATISVERMTKMLKGFYVEEEETAYSSPGVRHRALSDREAEFFAPLFVKGLQQATPEEIVTFFETAEISELYEATTSGGIFVKDQTFHMILSNYNVKTLIWRDNSEYEAPFRLRPLEPISPEPGRLVFEPSQFMVKLQRLSWFDKLKGEPWHAAVSYMDIP
ncbi:MAG: hypothetical protein MRJ96_00975 [Nitrospirales bacterium]|nr:hypothetical protein [Nitrospira sp.]MDR4500014.1 hypothetical protein [Nitrospirales bacterium]